MMHSNQLVVAIKVGGKILREVEDTVSLPFGCEYSILVKNLASVRAQFTVSVDGKVATEGTRLILDPYGSLELERFIKDGNNESGNRFKFIERTSQIEAHRGIGVEDGLIRIEAWKEHVRQFVDVPIPRYYDVPTPRWPRPPYPAYPNRPFGSSRMSSVRAGGPSMRGPNASLQAKSVPRRQERTDSGITVPGSHSDQRFRSVSGFALEPQSTVLILRLRGAVGEIAVQSPITVNTKIACQTCGKVSKGSSEFCGRCGTALVAA